MAEQGLREAYFDLLMEQVRSCRYPSPTMLDRVEQAVNPEQAEQYVRALLESVADARYPSTPMLDRLSGLIDALEPVRGSDGQ